MTSSNNTQLLNDEVPNIVIVLELSLIETKSLSIKQPVFNSKSLPPVSENLLPSTFTLLNGVSMVPKKLFQASTDEKVPMFVLIQVELLNSNINGSSPEKREPGPKCVDTLLNIYFLIFLCKCSGLS